MAHPLRLQILELLCEGPKGVNELQSRLQSQGSTVSQQPPSFAYLLNPAFLMDSRK
ncbi:ArsR family transcriptional regulator [Cohnella sp. REN36]|uniref:ArsR family transcriptional regulator n=1 Tax=Cohnella sp. REN36 TaxID=2887347 RepID=UPI001D14708A|nr:ArsR family transcriptional regulator [Cohnella sp. REN36]MCC3372213.1 ArsR family transcriptional regulator [Cohnella sp. REN36]